MTKNKLGRCHGLLRIVHIISPHFALPHLTPHFLTPPSKVVPSLARPDLKLVHAFHAGSWPLVLLLGGYRILCSEGQVSCW